MATGCGCCLRPCPPPTAPSSSPSMTDADSAERGPSLLLPMSGIQEGEEGGTRTRSEWIKGIAWARPLSLAPVIMYRVSEVGTPPRPPVMQNLHLHLATGTTCIRHTLQPFPTAFPSPPPISPRRTECAARGDGGGDNEDDMILSGPARPKSDPEEEGRTDADDVWFGPLRRVGVHSGRSVGRVRSPAGGRPSARSADPSRVPPPPPWHARDSCHRLRDLTPAVGAKLS